jgi:hypothetical protein
MVRDLAQHELSPIPGLGGAESYSADLLSWVTPPGYHRIWGRTFAHLNATVTGGERMTFPGFAVLALAGLGAVLVWRRARLWVALAAGFAVLSFGPWLHVDGHTGHRFGYLGFRFSLPLPYLVFHRVPILNGVRVPGRFGIMAVLALDVLAGLALARLGRGRRHLTGWLAAAAFAITMVEFLPPAGVQALVPAKLPAAYAAITADRTARAVLEIPLQWRDGFGVTGDGHPLRDDTLFVYFAARHHHPLVNGFVARIPTPRLRALSSIPLYREVLRLQGDLGDQAQPAGSFDAAALRRLGIGFVVYHRDRPEPAVLARIEAAGLRLRDDDGTVTVWEVPA